MKTLIRLAVLTATFSFLFITAQSQIVVDNSTYTPQQLANGILSGSCATIFNVAYTGNPLSIGTFSNGNSIGINNGVLLTTGSVDVAVGPNDAADATLVAYSSGSAALEAATGVTATMDACVLEFDFIPTGSTLNLKYVFASEEYPEYVCSQFNDVFAFLISGTGFAPNTNIALIPGTIIPVAINSINSGIAAPGFSSNNCTSLSYTNLYNDNTGGLAIQYDGYTDPLIATINVVANDTYHLKLAIADVGDPYLDSGVFIEGGSLGSGIYSTSLSICPGDSVFAAGAWQSASGTYYDTFTSAGGCDSIIATVLSVIGNLNNQVSISICQGDSLMFGNASYSTDGAFTDTFISREGCDSIVTLSLHVVDSFVINNSVVICIGDSFHIGGAWHTVSGIYYDSLISSGGCDSTVITNLNVQDDFVWPGDANDDGIVNNYDLIPVGVYIGSVGYARTTITNTWAGQCALPWNSIQTSGINRKHADCDGNGIVSRADTTAVSLNYSLTHAKSGGSLASGAPTVFKLVPRQSSYQPGDTVMLDVVIGDNVTPVSVIYGVAFNIEFDHSNVEPGSVQLNYFDSWMGLKADNLTLSKIFESSGQADGALVKTDHQDASGYGAIATLQFIANPNITTLETVSVSLTGFEAVDKDGIAVDLLGENNFVTIDGTTNITLNANQVASFNIYPNPFSNFTTIEYTLSNNAEVSFRVYDVLGRVVFENPVAIQKSGQHDVQFEMASGSGLFIFELDVDGSKLRERILQME